MNWLTNLLAGGAGSLVKQLKETADEFITSADERAEFNLKTQALVMQHEAALADGLRAELEARERVLVAELQQGDGYTKRARPTVVYAGLGFILYNYCLAPSLQTAFGIEVQPFALPTEFWLGWSGIVSTWSIGRTMERRGVQNRTTRAITGTAAPPASLLLN